MKKLFVAAMFAVFSLMLGGCGMGTIETGNVGIKTFMGTVSPTVEQAGFYMRPFSSVDEFSSKENAIEMNNLTPKAKDNLSLKDLDVTVYYKVAPDKIAGLYTKYAGQSARLKGDSYYLPAYFLVENVARSVIYAETANIDSLVIHTQRNGLEAAILKNLQAELNANDPSAFTVTRVTIRAVATDPTIEQAIQAQVQSQKQLETKENAILIARKDAQVKIAEAEGIAKANSIINNSLTREYLQHEYNTALNECAKRSGCTMIVGSAGGTLLNVSAK